jgi:ParB family transcriptional regulator, chromosome partitioning protein
MQETASLSHIRPGKNPREFFDEAEMNELAESIRSYGVLQPILVRPAGDAGTYVIIAGERRYRAAKAVFGDDYEMPIVVKDFNDGDAEAAAIVENVHRAQMSIAEEAKAAKRLLFRNKNDRAETARQLGWSSEKLDSRLALTACSDPVLRALTERKILVGHAELLAGVPPATQDNVLKGILDHKVPVAVLKAQLGKFARKLGDAIFDTGQCSACPHNSAMQAGLFGESLGEGYCQHPTHFDELTTQVVEAKAAQLKDEYQVIKIVRKEDGFQPLHLTAEGDLGVGAEQYESCKGCQSFGCSVSNMPGSYGEVTQSLCFDATCNSKKVAARRKAEREAHEAMAGLASATQESKTNGTKIAAANRNPTPSNQPPPRLLQYRVEQWRKWVANALMTQRERNQRALIALTLAGHGGQLSASNYGEAVGKITKTNKITGVSFKSLLEKSDGFKADHIDPLMKAITASAAFGVDQVNLEVLLNYLEIEEEKCFRLSPAFLDLFTKSELESLADELKLKKALGAQFKKLREGKREDFMKGLLGVKGFEYQGLVPKVMRYPRKKFQYSDISSAGEAVQGEVTEPVPAHETQAE